MTSATKTKPIATKYAPSVVGVLRALTPNRPLSFGEACRIGELQANRLLKLTDSSDSPVSEAIISELPRVTVSRHANLIGSGLTAWSRGLWHIRINSAEPITRQRFTLAHELKHVLDAASEDAIYRHLPKGPARKRHIEAVCDHFAACLLMPKSWVKKLWGEGHQDLAKLAWHFEVSQQAMLIRLQHIGLVEALPRCISWHRIGSAAVRGSLPGKHRSLKNRPSVRISGLPRYQRSHLSAQSQLSARPA